MEMHNPAHPGEIIREDCIKALGLTVTAAARGLGISRQSLSELLNGRAGVSAEMAIRLRRNPSQTTVATTSRAPATCDGAIAWPRIAHASTSANTGSTFMIAELPTTPRRGSTVKRIVMPVP